MRQGRVAGSKDDIRTEIDNDLGFEGLLDIDLADHPKALGLEGSLGARNCLLKTPLNMGRNVIAFDTLFPWRLSCFNSARSILPLSHSASRPVHDRAGRHDARSTRQFATSRDQDDGRYRADRKALGQRGFGFCVEFAEAHAGFEFTSTIR